MDSSCRKCRPLTKPFRAMYEEDDHNITVLRKRHRNGARNDSHNGSNGSSNGHANGHAKGHDTNGKQQSWGWTRGSKSFADDEERRAEMPRAEETRRRLHFDDASSRYQQKEQQSDAIKLPFDPWRFFAAVKRRWYWLFIGMIVVAALAAAAGNK